ncbi:MAG: tetratricopeptide repeat protein [Pyrinomonadaceae bacterium]|nr:tetratricopeptide repeat protein [Pyrinomonadaceae bacterium]
MSFNLSQLQATSRLAFLTFSFLLLSLMIAPGAVLAQEDEGEEFVQEGLAEPTPTVATGDPVKIFMEAQQAHESGELDKALELYGKAISILPEFPEAEYQRATIYQIRKQFSKAEDSLRKAVQFRQDWTLALAGLGSVLLRNGKLVEAEEVLGKAIRLNALNFPAYVALTDLYISSGFKGAKLNDLYSRLVYLSSKSKVPASIWACRGAVERGLGKFKEARSSIERALRLEPENRRALVEEVELALSQGDYTVAVQLSRKMVSRQAENTVAKTLLARSLAMSGKKNEALEVLASVEGPSAEIDKLTATIKTAGKINAKELELTLKEDPENTEILGALCSGFRINEPLKALKYCERAYKSEPNEVSHAIGFGAALVQLNRFGQAIKLLEQIKARFPNNHTVRANLGTAYFKIQNFEAAKNEYVWITKTQPKLPAAYFFLAITHDNLKEYLDAMANYQQFLRLADEKSYAAEISRVRLRMPTLQKQIDRGEGKK